MRGLSFLKEPIAGNSRIRKGSLVLFVLGVAGFFLVPALVERLLGQGQGDFASTSPAPQLAAPARPYQVRTPDGQSIGWLEVTYPQSIRENEEQTLGVKYVGERGAWAKVKDISAMSVSVQAANLGLFPEPFEYRFNLDRITMTGEDSHVWTVSPKQEGDYRLLLRFDVEPASFSALPVAVNGAEIITNGATALPVRVTTRYSVPRAWIDVLQAIGYVLSFILTLPLLKTFVERYVGRKAGMPGT